MIATGGSRAAAAPPAAAGGPPAEDAGRRRSDSGKARDQSPGKRFPGNTGLHTLQQHLTHRSSSPIGRGAVTSTAAAPSAGAASVHPWASSVIPPLADAHTAAAAAAAAAAKAPQPAPAAAAAPAAPAASTVPTTIAVTATASAAEQLLPVQEQQPQQQQAQQQQQQEQQEPVQGPGDPPGAAESLLQPSPVIVMTDAAVAAGSAEPGAAQQLSGKRKFLEGANSTELQYDAHVKSPAHTYDAAARSTQPQQQGQQGRQQQEQPDASKHKQRDQQPQQSQPQGDQQKQDQTKVQKQQLLSAQREKEQQQQQMEVVKEEEEEEDQPMPDVQPEEPQQQQQEQTDLQQEQQQQAPAVPPCPPLVQGTPHPAEQQPAPQQPQPTAEQVTHPNLHNLQDVASCPPQEPAVAQQQQQQQPLSQQQVQQQQPGQQQQQQPSAPEAAQAAAAVPAGKPSSSSSSGSPAAAAAAGSTAQHSAASTMKPPSLVDMARRVLGRRPELFGPSIDSSSRGSAAPKPSRGLKLGPLRRSRSQGATGNPAAAAPATAAPAAAGPAGPAAGLGVAAAGECGQPLLQVPPLRTRSSDTASMASNTMSAGSSPLAGTPMSMSPVSWGDLGPHGASAEGGEGAGLFSEPSLDAGGALERTLSSAASLELWLGPGSRGASGSPRALTAAAAAAAAATAAAAAGSGQQLPGTGSDSHVSLGSAGGQVGSLKEGSLVLGQHMPSSPGADSLHKQASFGGWPVDAAPAAVAGLAAAAAAAGGGSFSWPPAPRGLVHEDSLKLDIQMLPAVIPESYPEEPPAALTAAGGPPFQQHAPYQHDAHLQQQQQRELSLREQHQVDRALFAKVAAWEDELVEMLERQLEPVAIRAIVSVFKDRIHTERDKAEFKALCDKWTGVVEYPAGSGIKCLAIKSWMRGSHSRHHHHHHFGDDDSDDVGDWDD